MIDLSSLPPWLAETIIFAAIVAGAYLLSEIVVLIVNLVKRYLATRTETDLDDKILDAVKAPIRYVMIFVGVTIAGGRAHDRRNAELAARERQRQLRDKDSVP